MAHAPKRTLLPALWIGAALAGPAAAADYPVTRQDDPVPNGCVPGDCSLREAVLAANATAAADRVLLPASFTPYALVRPGANEDLGAGGDLDIVGELEIAGVSAPQAVIVQSQVDRLMHVQPGGRLVLRNLTLTGGRQVAHGGAVFVPSGSLVLRGSVLQLNSALERGGAVFVGSNSALATALDSDDTDFHDNSAPDGGAVFIGGQPMAPTFARIERAGFNENAAVARGGALAFELSAGSRVDVRHSAFTGNDITGPGGRGGAIANGTRETTLLAIEDSRFEFNRATGSDTLGGAVFEAQRVERSGFTQNEAAVGGALYAQVVEVRESEFCDNAAVRNGGAIDARVASVHASTFCRNAVTGSGPGDGGGALHLGAFDAALGVSRSTFDANLAAAGGAILQLDGELEVVQSTLVAPDPADPGAAGTLVRYDGGVDGDPVEFTANLIHGRCDFPAGNGVLMLAQHNLIAPGDGCGFSPASPARPNNRVFGSVAEIGLLPLADNGGPTRTRLPEADGVHPAVDHVPDPACGYPLDQRGFQRTDAACDAGAVETGAELPPAPRIFADGFE